MKNYVRYMRNRKGQGTTEYIIILAIAVSLALVAFWGKIKPKLDEKIDGIATGIQDAGKK